MPTFLYLLASIAAAQVAPESFTAAWYDFDGDGIDDIAISLPGTDDGCSVVDIWLSSDGPFPLESRPVSPLRRASLTLMTDGCEAVLGPLEVRGGDLVVGAYARTYGEYVVASATIARNRGTLLLPAVAPPPQDPADLCWFLPGSTPEWPVWECSNGEVYYPCDPCCGDSSCCITDICGG